MYGFVWTNMDILDIQNQKVAHLVQLRPTADSEGGVKVCINAHPNHSDGHLKEDGGQKANVLSHQFPSDLMLVRLQHDKQKGLPNYE
ncbi:hypothetical protein E1189_03730 [Sansalvadorimonas verongulae]|nr:hypothetical protein [Sansalvadorimonas verongulae]